MGVDTFIDPVLAIQTVYGTDLKAYSFKKPPRNRHIPVALK